MDSPYCPFVLAVEGVVRRDDREIVSRCSGFLLCGLVLFSNAWSNNSCFIDTFAFVADVVVHLPITRSRERIRENDAEGI